ncbi:MAG: MFS transporter [Rhodospirillaceae bacterium]|nr:MFS transporter [Rhodospirillaceae bacterium]
MPGLAFAAWGPLVPFAKERAGLDDAQLGLVLLGLGAGALLSMPLAGALTARLGCRTVLMAATLLICAVLPALSWIETPALLAAALFIFGIGIGAMDCAINVQAVMVERDSDRAMMSGFHAFYSIGGLTGAAAMAALLSLGLSPLTASATATAVVFGLLLSVSAHWRTDRIAHSTPAFARPRGVVAFIGLLCFITFLCEGAILDWSAVFLTGTRGMDAAQAGWGFALFSLAMTVMRLFGDRQVRRLGRYRTIALGSLVASAGFLIMTLIDHPAVSLFGCALIGGGCANIIPALFSLAGQQKVMPATLAIPAVTTLGYAGILAGPALIGFIADISSLATAFAGIAAAMIAVAAAARPLTKKTLQER